MSHLGGVFHVLVLTPAIDTGSLGGPNLRVCRPVQLDHISREAKRVMNFSTDSHTPPWRERSSSQSSNYSKTFKVVDKVSRSTRVGQQVCTVNCPAYLDHRNSIALNRTLDPKLFGA
jgi:hypothetical protein